MKLEDFQASSLDELFKLGSVNVHNIGPDHVVVDFLVEFKPSGHAGIKYRGEGKYLLAAIASLKLSESSW